jgi:hypothetical protein
VLALARAVLAATEQQNHHITALEFRETPQLTVLIGKLEIGEHSSGNEVVAHDLLSPLWPSGIRCNNN